MREEAKKAFLDLMDYILTINDSKTFQIALNVDGFQMNEEVDNYPTFSIDVYQDSDFDNGKRFVNDGSFHIHNLTLSNAIKAKVWLELLQHETIKAA